MFNDDGKNVTEATVTLNKEHLMKYYENNTVFTLKNYILFCINVCILANAIFVRVTEGAANVFLVIASIVSFFAIMLLTKGMIDEVRHKKNHKRSQFRG
tara:strand:- start:266 stop:562 length:297 start_codon:yes stop_codon:yes gene_type:complete